MNRKLIMGLIGFAVVAIVVLIILSSIRKKKEIKKIRKQVSEGISEGGEPDVRTYLSKAKADASFTEQAKKLAKIIFEADKAWYVPDDHEAVNKALSGKTISQIKSIDDAFQNSYGKF